MASNLKPFCQISISAYNFHYSNSITINQFYLVIIGLFYQFIRKYIHKPIRSYGVNPLDTLLSHRKVATFTSKEKTVHFLVLQNFF